MRIISLGGGPAGLYAALLLKLADPRHEVSVIERDPPGTVRGWGVTFWDDLLDGMRASDPESAAEIAQAAARWDGLETEVQGRPRVVQQDFWGHSISRSTLISVLSRRAEALGVEIRYGQQASADDLATEADLVIAADGVRSGFRTAHSKALAARVDNGRNQFVWLSTPKPFPAFRFIFAQPAAGWACAYAYAYSAQASTFVAELPPETYENLGLSGMDAAESMATLEDVFGWQLDGHPLSVQPKDDGTAPWGTFPTVWCQQWYDGNVAVMGDAAHTTHYSIGFGTKLALEDAIGLARSMAQEGEVSAGLRRYQEQRIRDLRVPRRDARYSQRWFEQVERYLPLGTDDFAALLNRRRSPLVAYLPPRAISSVRRMIKR